MPFDRLHIPRELDSLEAGVGTSTRTADQQREDLREALHFLRETQHQVNKTYENVIAGKTPPNVTTTGTVATHEGSDTNATVDTTTNNTLNIARVTNGVQGATQSITVTAGAGTAKTTIVTDLNASASRDGWVASITGTNQITLTAADTGTDNGFVILASTLDAAVGWTEATYAGTNGGVDTYRTSLATARSSLGTAYAALKDAWDVDE